MPRTVQLAVPQRARAVLAKVAGLPDEDRAALEQAFTSDQVLRALPELKERIAAVLVDDDADRLIRELVGLSSLAASHSYPLLDVAATVSASPDLKIDAAQRDRLRQLLELLLSSPAVNTLGKAIDLYQEQPNILHTARLVSDIRPLIADDADAVDGAVIVHHLRLAYFADGTSAEVDLTINRNDIAELIRILQRAQRKEQLLTDFLDASAVTVFDTTAD